MNHAIIENGRARWDWVSRGILSLGILLANTSLAATHHHIDLRLDPRSGHLQAVDRIRLDAPTGDRFHFRLDQGLEIEDRQDIQRLGSTDHGQVEYRATLRPGDRTLTLRYSGQLSAHSPKGINLDPGDAWYPGQAGDLETYALQLDLPKGWDAISQGRRTSETRAGGRHRIGWQEHHPQQGLFLIVAPLHRYSGSGPIATEVDLRQPDPSLAQRYLEATGPYLEFYSRLLGAYPYAKFAAVENFRETGYGMPSFTLLGSRVMRLPFILHSSYPHEILHNWWGNGVYVDPAGGNWSEGLTAYLADHLLQEQRGKGREYRRSALQKYTDYVATTGRDFPIGEFRSRHDGATQAVGYSKTLMVFHQLRRQLGDDAFLGALRDFYRQFRFHRASFDDLRRAFEARSGQDLRGFFAQWIQRPGAPWLGLEDIHLSHNGNTWRLDGRLVQRQQGTPFRLRIPLLVRLEGHQQGQEKVLTMDTASQEFHWDLPARPLRLDLDPGFDLFRRLDPAELPPSFGQLFAKSAPLVVLPGKDDPLRPAYRKAAQRWQRRQPGLEIRAGDALERLPVQRPVWLLGRNNPWLKDLRQALSHHGIEWTKDHFSISGQRVTTKGRSFALVSDRHSAPLAWMVATRAEALAAVARKLPHYGKFSYVIFTGPQAKAVTRGQWPVQDSPMSVNLTDRSMPRQAEYTSPPPLATWQAPILP